MKNQPTRIDPKTLSPKEIREAIIENCTKLGSYGYFIADEIARAEADPAGVIAYQWAGEKVRAYYRSPEQRAQDAARDAAIARAKGAQP